MIQLTGPHSSLLRNLVRTIYFCNVVAYSRYPSSFQGMLTVQAYVYYESFPNDPMRLKSLVSCPQLTATYDLICSGGPSLVRSESEAI